LRLMRKVCYLVFLLAGWRDA